jgi:hypothetical protein
MIGYWQTNWDDESHGMTSLTLGQAVNDLLTRYSQATGMRPSIGGSQNELVFSKNWNSPVSAYRLISDEGSNTDFDRMYRLVQLMQTMTIGYQDERRKEILDVDLNVIVRVAAYQAHGRVTVVPTKESYASYGAILKFAIEWMVGCRLDVLQIDDADSIAAACLAIECELDGQTAFAVAFSEALAVA